MSVGRSAPDIVVNWPMMEQDEDVRSPDRFVIVRYGQSLRR